ncbi:MAG: hypothetical protein ABI333_08200 [bacterium]
MKTKYGKEVLRCLGRIQDLALRAGPARSLECTALLNVALVYCETDGSDRMTAALAGALRAWREECGAALPAAEFDRELQRLMTLLLKPPPPRPDHDENPPATRYSLGPQALEQLALLRADLGLSILFIYRHFAEHLRFRLPYPDFLASLDELADHATRAVRYQAGGR